MHPFGRRRNLTVAARQRWGAIDPSPQFFEGVAGNANITAGGSFDVCALPGSDDSMSEASVGTVTI